jgi:hypothetical protein
MTSSETHAPLSTMGKPESPWMVDGGGMPPNSLALMKRLVWLSSSFFMYQEFVLIPSSCIWLMYGLGLCSLLSNVQTAI